MEVATIVSERLELVWMSDDFIRTLLAGERREAERLLGILLPEGWPDEHDERFLRFRLNQMERDPTHSEWLVRAVVLPRAGRDMIGSAGFHGKPGTNARQEGDAVELGYSIFEPFRRQGYATETVRALIRWANEERGIERFIASVAPDNAPSLAIVRKLGFAQVGRHWDEVDGEELEFELTVP